MVARINAFFGAKLDDPQIECIAIAAAKVVEEDPPIAE